LCRSKTVARRHLIDHDNEDEKKERAPLPCFGGTRGAEIENSLYEIEDSFNKHVHTLSSVAYDILDVRATTSQWLHDYGLFKTGLEEVEVMMIDVIETHWLEVTRIQVGVELLEAFYHLAVRNDMIKCIQSKSRSLYIMFEAEVKAVQEGIFQKFHASPPLAPGHPKYAGRALWARMLVNRLKEQAVVLEAAYWLPTHAVEQEAAFAVYNAAMKKINAYISETHITWKEEELGAHAVNNDATIDSFLSQKKLMTRTGDEEGDGKSEKKNPLDIPVAGELKATK
jgi:dynein heavy chain